MRDPSTRPPLSPAQLQRYARHLTLPEIGLAGQQRLHDSSILLVGAGGLGSPAALYLAAAGVGTIGIVDDDVVELTNLQRQVIHGTAAIGTTKVDSATARIRDLNPEVEVRTHPTRLARSNAREIIAEYDLVVDGSDNFPTRYLVNDACVLERTPFVYGSIYRFEGQLSVFATEAGPCYRCLFAEPPAPELVPSCAEAGVLGVLPGIIGSMQALEAIKLLTGIGNSAVGRLLLFDALGLGLREIAIQADDECAVCSTSATVTELIDYEIFCGAGAGESGAEELSVGELEVVLGNDDPPYLIDVRESWEFDIAHLADSHLIPLAELPGRLAELPTDRALVTICHHGLRSMTAAKLLAGAGFGVVWSLSGGVDRWAREVDLSMSRY